MSDNNCILWLCTKCRVKHSKFCTHDSKCIFTDSPRSGQAIVENTLFLRQASEGMASSDLGLTKKHHHQRNNAVFGRNYPRLCGRDFQGLLEGTEDSVYPIRLPLTL